MIVVAFEFNKINYFNLKVKILNVSVVIMCLIILLKACYADVLCLIFLLWATRSWSYLIIKFYLCITCWIIIIQYRV